MYTLHTLLVRATLTYICAVLVTSVVLFMVVLVQVKAHDAPSGWTYPSRCCGGNDCHPVPCAEIGNLPPDYFTWHEIIFSSAQHNYSGDGKCHVCTNTAPITKGGPNIPRCIFTPVPVSS